MPDLTTLTDDDIVLNLYLTVVMAIEVTEADPDKVLMSVSRGSDTETTVEETATLQDLMTEVERRLDIDRSAITFTEEARLQ
jgi:hypothetical protein